MKKPAGSAADLLLTNGRIHTGNPQQPRAEAIAIHGNRIVAVGSSAGLANLGKKGTRIVDLGGRFACAGFVDAHVHLLSAGLSLSRANLSGCPSRDEMLSVLRDKAAALPEGAWVQGRGWDQERLEGAWPRREWLDETLGDRPAVVWRVDGHILWASSAALAAAGITAETPDPAGGEIVRDGTGRPTGILKENACALMESAVPPLTAEERREAVESALAELRRHGVTSVHEMSPPEVLRTCAGLREEGRLSVRVSAWAPLEEDLSQAERLREQYPPSDPMIRMETLKGFVDGTLGARTAAMSDPYADEPSTSGMLLYDEEGLARILRRAHRSGFQLALHAIGDRAVHVALSALDGLGGGARARRHRIEHAEVVSAGDVSRFNSVGAVASMQPGQLASDGLWLARRLGPGRLSRAFPWRALVDQGTPLIFGTDWPIEPLSPVRTLATACGPARAFLPAEQASGLADQGRLTVGEALDAMTRAGAWATFEDGIKGSLSAGRLADIVVLSADPFTMPPEALGELTVDLTVFDGRIVHARE